MSPITADVLQVTALVVALALAYRPLGDHMAAVYSSDRHLRVERLVYRCLGADPDAEPGKMAGNLRQGYAILAAMGLIWVGFVTLMTWAEFAHPGSADHIAGA
ncbi:hypothetical protein [Actinacidiphila sp. bgisy160]|uniref:hypothetical protein n=1 Tax=Actinacidiphila sp. bgisy160 TaxID=3413796 RepID=UPI003D748FE2